MAFFKNPFKQPTQEETIEKITQLQQQEKLLGAEERVFSKKSKLQESVSGLKRKKFGRSIAGKAAKALGKVGVALVKGSGKVASGEVDLFGSPEPKRKSRKKSKSDDIDDLLGF